MSEAIGQDDGLEVGRAAFDPATHPADVVEYYARLNGAAATDLPRSVGDLRTSVDQVLRDRRADDTERDAARSARDLELRVGNARLQVRLFERASARGLAVHLHGGGWTVGSHTQQDGFLARLSSASDFVVASVDYRLAPEWPYPVPLEDSVGAVLALAEVFPALPIVVVGESAGANLGLSAAVRLKTEAPDLDLRGLDLSYGAYDLRLTPSARQASSGALRHDLLEWFIDLYLPPGTDRSDPAVSPLFADLRGLPAVHLMVGTADPLLDDTLFLHGRLVAAGVHSSLDLVPAAGHALLTTPLSAAARATDRSASFLRACLDR